MAEERKLQEWGIWEENRTKNTERDTEMLLYIKMYLFSIGHILQSDTEFLGKVMAPPEQITIGKLLDLFCATAF